MDCPGDPIPAANKILNVDNLVRNEKRVGLKNLHVVNVPPATTFWATLDFHSLLGAGSVIKIVGTGAAGGSIGFVLPKSAQPTSAAGAKGSKKSTAATETKLEGIVVRKLTDQMIKSLRERLPNEAGKRDLTRLYALDKDAKGGGSISGTKIPKEGLRAAVLLTAPAKVGDFDTFSVVQEEEGKIVGGSTYVILASKQ
jgi:hypothetical protein